MAIFVVDEFTLHDSSVDFMDSAFRPALLEYQQGVHLLVEIRELQNVLVFLYDTASRMVVVFVVVIAGHDERGFCCNNFVVSCLIVTLSLRSSFFLH
jgi:hypothetical protein